VGWGVVAGAQALAKIERTMSMAPSETEILPIFIFLLLYDPITGGLRNWQTPKRSGHFQLGGAGEPGRKKKEV
jgi:hypothetical protein